MIPRVSRLALWSTVLMAGVSLALIGCGTDDVEVLVDDATAVAALTEGEGEPLDGTPQGEVDAAALEEVNGQEESGTLSQQCAFAALRETIRAAYDLDGDGQLDEEEGQALAADLGQEPRQRHRWARQHRLQRLHWIYDADDSGDLSDDERAALRADLDVRCANRQAYLLDAFDADSDGSLSSAEWEDARTELAARVQARNQAQLDACDANHNGQIDAAERDDAVAARRQEMSQRREELRAQYDADHSGSLEGEELVALREQLRSRVRGEHFAVEDTF